MCEAGIVLGVISLFITVLVWLYIAITGKVAE